MIYGSSLEDQFVTEARTPVTYHKKNPNFCSEAKIKLDPRLGPEHHLLFTFHNCSASTKKQSGEIEVHLQMMSVGIVRVLGFFLLAPFSAELFRLCRDSPVQ